MSIEKALADLTAAVKANTEAHEKLAAVAAQVQAAKPPAEEKPAKASTKTTSKAKAAEEKAAEDTAADAGETSEQQEAEPEKEAPKKQTSRSKASANKATKPDPITSIEFDDLKKMAKAFISPDDEKERDDNKGKLGAALDHLGAASLGKVEAEDMPRVATYLAYWQAGLDVDFEEIDSLIAEASEDSEGSDEGSDDEMLD